MVLYRSRENIPLKSPFKKGEAALYNLKVNTYGEE
jgi:hypothetical protein